MAEKTRQQRESLTKKPFEEMDEAARGQSQGSGGAETLKRAVITAAAGALAAGLAGATKALRDRRSSQAEAEPAEEPDEGEEPETHPEVPDPLDQAAAPEAEGEAQDDRVEEEPSEQRAEASESSEGDEPEETGTGEAAEIVRQARRQLETLLGSKPESVSGFEHADGKWSVTLEVVDVRRVPESTDVLSSYQVVLDNERNLVRATRLRRYRRSQVEET
jgi:hypothetical protein